MKNRNGFTLIELLAVIVILAIIAVIATPIILNVVDESRKSAAADSAYGAVSSIRTYYATSQIGTTPEALPLTIDFSAAEDLALLSISGTKPSQGVVTLEDDGTFTVTSALKIGNYYCSYASEAFSCSTTAPSLPPS